MHVRIIAEFCADVKIFNAVRVVLVGHNIKHQHHTWVKIAQSLIGIFLEVDRVWNKMWRCTHHHRECCIDSHQLPSCRWFGTFLDDAPASSVSACQQISFLQATMPALKPSWSTLERDLPCNLDAWNVAPQEGGHLEPQIIGKTCYANALRQEPGSHWWNRNH